jgi:NADP-dependent 3-hydroxy acid dehydrogenase YdfG
VKRLYNKIALVIGFSSSGNTGYATANRFVDEGAKVMVAARDPDDLTGGSII